MPASASGSVKPPHPVSASRVVPAIPHALTRARQSQDKIASHVAPAQDHPAATLVSLDQPESSEPTPVPNGDHQAPVSSNGGLNQSSEPTDSLHATTASEMEHGHAQTSVVTLPQAQREDSGYASPGQQAKDEQPSIPSPALTGPGAVADQVSFGSLSSQNNGAFAPGFGPNFNNSSVETRRGSNDASPAVSVPGYPPPQVPYNPPNPGFAPQQPGNHAYRFSDPSAGSPSMPPQGPPPYGPPRSWGRDKYNFPSHAGPPRMPMHHPHMRSGLPNKMPDNYGPQPRSFNPAYGPHHLYPMHGGLRPGEPFHDPTRLEYPAYYDFGPPAVMSPMQNGFPGPQGSHAVQTPQTPNFPTGALTPSTENHALNDLGLFVHSQFGNPVFSDCLLRLSHVNGMFPPAAIPCHAIILARSPKLRSLMMQDRSFVEIQAPNRMLTVPIVDKFLSHRDALMKAIHRLYADQVPLSQDSCGGDATAELEQVNFGLAFAAAGHFLQLEDVVNQGLDLVTHNLTWNTIDKVFSFALDGGLASTWYTLDGSSEDSKDKDSASSFDETPSKLASPAAAPTYGVYSDRLLSSALDFIVQKWPSEFQLSTLAPQSSLNLRLPVTSDRRGSSSNSRLAHIRFGELSADDVDPVTSTLSTLLLSLPFPLVKYLMEHTSLVSKLGATEVAKAARAVVDEREQRRQTAAKSRGSAAPLSATEESLWNNVRWVECVEDSQHSSSDVKVTRCKLDIDTPTSTYSTGHRT